MAVRRLRFSFAAVFLGLGVLVASAAPPLVLGLLISTAVLMSFLASVWLLPVAIRLLDPGFLHRSGRARHRRAS